MVEHMRAADAGDGAGADDLAGWAEVAFPGTTGLRPAAGVGGVVGMFRGAPLLVEHDGQGIPRALVVGVCPSCARVSPGPWARPVHRISASTTTFATVPYLRGEQDFFVAYGLTHDFSVCLRPCPGCR